MQSDPLPQLSQRYRRLTNWELWMMDLEPSEHAYVQFSPLLLLLLWLALIGSLGAGP